MNPSQPQLLLRSDDASGRDGEPPRGRKLLLIDAANTLYRAFFALPPLRNAEGFPTNAVLGFANMLHKVLREEQPDFVAVVMDAPGGSFRNELYGEYKATRDKQPEDLSQQIPVFRELVALLGLPLVECPGFEADDVIATFAARAPEDVAVRIVSSDKDLMQLVGDRVRLLDTMKDREIGPAEVEARFGVGPDQVLDLRALVGDPSDNIPGVKGIGEKGAAKLIQEWGDLETLLAHAADVKAKRAREALVEQADAARLSRQLATLRDDVELPVSLDACVQREPEREPLAALYRRLEFTRLLAALEKEDPSAPPAPASEITTRLVETAADLAAMFETLAGEETVTLSLVATGPGAMQCEPAGLAVARGETEAAYVPFGHADAVAGTPDRQAVFEALADLLGGASAPAWHTRDAKTVQVLAAEAGVPLPEARVDVEIQAFLLDPAAARTTAALASRHLGRELAPFQDLVGKGAKAVTAPEVERATAAAWAGAEVCALRSLVPLLRDALERDGLTALFENVEMPLTGVLARMEREGVRIDEAFLAALSEEYAAKLAEIEREIHALAGEAFLISSPKQLQTILFEKLKLPVIRKTKTGYSTDESVLEQLSAEHPLPAKVLAHRQLAKLKSTYVDALPPLVSPHSGRIHPSFHQTGAATGRLSSSHPNVQNIPIRTEEGVRIREAFVPAEGALLLSADYSQVELRILAHYSGDESLLEAFQKGEDVHTRTAAEVQDVETDAVTPDQRARAKAVNFGIIYGSSAFGLARQLGIATGEAQETIDRYFERYSGVRTFLDGTIEAAREEGFVRTLLGRRRYLPDLRSRNRVLRTAAERMAVNSVIQGTAADLIKKAMVDVDAAIASGELPGRMLLQVHDELVFEVPAADLDRLGEGVRQAMETVWPLRAPLRVDLGSGRSWREAH